MKGINIRKCNKIGKTRKIRRKTKRAKRKRNTAHSMETQVSGNQIDQELNGLIDTPQDGFHLYKSYRMWRKRIVYPRTFMGAKVPPPLERTEIVPYDFGPITIRKRD